MKVIDIQTEYKVEQEKSVSLSIIIGDAQLGTSIVKLDNDEIARREIRDCNIGVGNSIRGKKLRIKSIVSDVNDMSNKTSITYLLKGGFLDQSFCSKGTVEEDGDSVIYRAVFLFV